MPIDVSKLVSAAVLQNVIVDDQTGEPLANGVIWLYEDNARTVPKNWYYQSGTAGAYEYITLPNPLTLNAAGAITDNNGNDTDPFYYPYAEQTVGDIQEGDFQPYYITVQDQFGAQKFIRQNFPFIGQVGGNPPTPPGSSGLTNKNYLINGEFWRNIATIYQNTSSGFNATVLSNSFVLNGLTYYYAPIAPSQHDGFSQSEMIFVKNQQGVAGVSGIDTISFKKFPLGSTVLENPPNGGMGVTPDLYFNLNCTVAGSETVKYIQWPIALHVQNFTQLNAIFSFAAQNAGGSNATITVSIFPYLGSGVTSPTASIIKTITLTTGWIKYNIPFSFPDMTLSTIASTGGGPSDDAWYIQIGFQAGVTTNINIALPKLYLGNEVPSNDFDNYDQINAIISDPHTGDIKLSNNTYMFGYVPANDGTIGSPSSNATTYANSDSFKLYNLLWNLAQPFDSGSNFNPICQMYTSAGSTTNYGSSSIADYTANKQLALTKAFGRVMAGTVTLPVGIFGYDSTVTASNSAGNLLLTVNGISNFFQGQAVNFDSTGTLPDSLVANAIYYVTNINVGAQTFNVATTYANAIAGTPVVAWVSSGGSGNHIRINHLASYLGQYNHTLLSKELPDPLVTNSATFSAGAGASSVIANASGVYTGGAISNSGGNQPSNITQPLTFYNVFFKL